VQNNLVHQQDDQHVKTLPPLDLNLCLMRRKHMFLTIMPNQAILMIVHLYNNNNNLFLRSRSSHTKLVYETPLFVGQGIPLHPTI
jgi:hypothetical protein